MPVTGLGFWKREPETETESEEETETDGEDGAETEPEFNPWSEAALCIFLLAFYTGNLQLTLFLKFDPLGFVVQVLFSAAVLNGLAYWRGL